MPDSQQRDRLTQYCSHNADKPSSLTHTHSHSESTGATHRSCCWSSAQRIVPVAVLLVAVKVAKDIDEFEIPPEMLWIWAYSPPPPPPDIRIVQQHNTQHLHTPREHMRLTQHDYLDR